MLMVQLKLMDRFSNFQHLNVGDTAEKRLKSENMSIERSFDQN